jgi:hypothetical protein
MIAFSFPADWLWTHVDPRVSHMTPPGRASSAQAMMPTRSHTPLCDVPHTLRSYRSGAESRDTQGELNGDQSRHLASSLPLSSPIGAEVLPGKIRGKGGACTIALATRAGRERTERS